MIRLLQSLVCGVLVTGALMAVALAADSEAAFCILLWQACLLEALFGPSNLHNPGPLFLGMFLGVPIYAAVAYVILGKVRASPKA